MISCQNLRFAYSPAKTFDFPDLTCGDRDAVLILGQSGRGKTTFLHLLALLLKPESGRISIAGQEMTDVSPAQLVKLRSRNIGIIYQRPHFVSSLSVMDNILLASYLAGEDQDKKKAGYLAEQLGFSDHLSKNPSRLSQGEQQRVSIARSLMNNPNVILADEPTSNLDDNNCRKVVELLKKQSASIGASLVVVTHDQRLKDEFSNQVFL